VEAILESGVYIRDAKWTQSIAIGTQRFVENTVVAIQTFGLRLGDLRLGEGFSTRISSPLAYTGFRKTDADDKIPCFLEPELTGKTS
jgi:hypothetical protein